MIELCYEYLSVWCTRSRRDMQGVPWHSGNCRVWIHSETRTWHDKNIQSMISWAIYLELIIVCYVGKYIAKWLDLLLICSFYHFLSNFLAFSGVFLLLVYLLTITYILKHLTIVIFIFLFNLHVIYIEKKNALDKKTGVLVLHVENHKAKKLKQPPEVKKGVLRNFTKSTGKHLWQSL